MKDVKEFVESAQFRSVLKIIGVLAVALLLFQAGVFVGFHMAAFSYRGGDNYYRVFHGEPGRMMVGFQGDRFTPAHGAIGRVVSVNFPTIVVEDNDNVEKIVLIGDDTAIRRFHDVVKASDIQVNDNLIVIGEPNSNSQIEARLIRLMPPLPSGTGTMMMFNKEVYR